MRRQSSVVGPARCHQQDQSRVKQRTTAASHIRSLAPFAARSLKKQYSNSITACRRKQLAADNMDSIMMPPPPFRHPSQGPALVRRRVICTMGSAGASGSHSLIVPPPLVRMLLLLPRLTPHQAVSLGRSLRREDSTYVSRNLDQGGKLRLHAGLHTGSLEST